MSDLRKLFKPQQDITVYELAQIMPHIATSAVEGLGWRFTQEGWENWKTLGLARHFVDGSPSLWDDYEELKLVA